MANRRKFIAGLGALATGSAAAMGTGAFSTMTAERTANINVTNDASGLIGLSAKGEQASKENGELYIDTSAGNGSGSSGVNPNSTYQFGKTEDATWDVSNYRGEGAGTAGYAPSVDPSVSIAEWYGTHYDGTGEIETNRTFTDLKPVDGNRVSDALFTVQNNDIQPHDIILTFDDEIVSALGEDIEGDKLTLEFENVGAGEYIDVALVVLAGNEELSAEGSIQVTAE